MSESGTTAAGMQTRESHAINDVQAVRPYCVGVRRAGDVISAADRCIFHAGPPYRSPSDIPAPVLHSAAQAAFFEGWYPDVVEAMSALRSGEIRTASAQDHRLMVPLAGVLSASMLVLEIADPALELAPVWVALNEGQRHATRLGRLDGELTQHLHWLNGAFGQWLAQCFGSPLSLLPIIAQAHGYGDDCHARTVVGSELIAAELLQRAPQASEDVRTFLRESPAFALNFWMGAAALAASAVEGSVDSSIVTRAGGNGVEFGIQLAARPGEWVCMQAPVPVGELDAAHSKRHAVGALGDSAVVDFSGLGGQSLRTAPLVAQAVKNVLPQDALQRSMQVLVSGECDIADGLSATSAECCVAAGTGPLVLIGMIDAEGVAGRIGGGVVNVPVALFKRALEAN